MSNEDKIKIGQAWAEILMLKKSRDHKDRFLTTWGDKSALGIYETITRLVRDQETKLN